MVTDLLAVTQGFDALGAISVMSADCFIRTQVVVISSFVTGRILREVVVILLWNVSYFYYTEVFDLIPLRSPIIICWSSLYELTPARRAEFLSIGLGLDN